MTATAKRVKPKSYKVALEPPGLSYRNPRNIKMDQGYERPATLIIGHKKRRKKMSLHEMHLLAIPANRGDTHMPERLSDERLKQLYADSIDEFGKPSDWSPIHGAEVRAILTELQQRRAETATVDRNAVIEACARAAAKVWDDSNDASFNGQQAVEVEAAILALKDTP
jgi:hypothetical protein